jgi:hypothetical protein
VPHTERYTSPAAAAAAADSSPPFPLLTRALPELHEWVGVGRLVGHGAHTQQPVAPPHEGFLAAALAAVQLAATLGGTQIRHDTSAQHHAACKDKTARHVSIT